MRNIILLSICFTTSIICLAQSEAVNAKADSISYISRQRADAALRPFENLKAKKILYSISDEQYYVIVKQGLSYKEYYIVVDSSGKVRKRRLVSSSNKNQMKSLMIKAFNINNYQKYFITKLEHPSIDQGNSSYFVLKDENGKRYGEYSLDVIINPVPIDKQLYVYLVTSLLRESVKSTQRY
jgi:hypothetical protein